jgi:four helix bundle protein
MDIKSHRDLEVWRKSVHLGLHLYEATAAFPADERFGLTSQIRRAGVSIASNIAEGYGRGSTKDYVRFLRVARGSLHEIDTQCLFAVKLKYLEVAKYRELLEEVEEIGRMLGGLIRSIERQ